MKSPYIPSPDSPDLSLPDWGPYSKRFFGLSHITDREKGTRFDFTVIPGIYRRELGIPDALRPSGYLPWNVSADLESYSYRQQLIPKDRLYCDISFVPGGRENLKLIECRFVNRTNLPVSCALHLVASLVPEPMKKTGIKGAEKSFRPETDPIRGLVFDCLHECEIRTGETTTGSAFRFPAGKKFYFHAGAFGPGKIFLRCKTEKALLLNGSIRIPESESWQFAEVFSGSFSGGKMTFEANGEILADSFFLSESGKIHEENSVLSNAPEIESEDVCSIQWHYTGTDLSYALKTDRPFTFRRIYSVRDFNRILLYEDGIHQPFLEKFGCEDGPDRHLDTVIQPVTVEAESECAIRLAVGCGSSGKLAGRMFKYSFKLADALLKEGEKSFFHADSPYRFSQERMAAVTLSNVVYPTYFRGIYAKHHTPGRRWNSLYTWDSGFIGLGLMEIDLRRAVENLNAYLMPENDTENAFVLHGSPVPVQIYLFFELWNRLHNRGEARNFYKRVLHFYNYLAGHAKGSLTRKHSKEPAVCTWDYFYNSAGWDDYPAQMEVHRLKDYNIVPCAGTSHIVRCAKMLRMIAREIGEDTTLFDGDIDDFTNSLQQYYYDAEAGYFSYLKHDSEGNPAGFLKTERGENFNCGLDGLLPLAAGAVTPEQKELLWTKLESPSFMTPCGLSTVDRTSVLSRDDGYWNGSVWMPYQWFFWKAALTEGRSEFAWKIASTALELWEMEVQSSYACYEQFPIRSGRGGGWHHFSALSAPVLNWNATYSKTGTLTSGYDTLIRETESGKDFLKIDLAIAGESGTFTTFIAVVPWEGKTSAHYDGGELAVRQRPGNAVETLLPKNTSGTLTLTKI